MLKNAGLAETLQKKLNVMFGDGGCFRTYDYEDFEQDDDYAAGAAGENETGTAGEKVDEDELEILKKQRQNYKMQKLRFTQIQKFLKSKKIRKIVDDNKDASSFYSDSWPAACVAVSPAVSAIKQRCLKLLEEFNNSNPALIKVLEMVSQEDVDEGKQ